MRATRATPAIAACEAVNRRSAAAVALALFVAVLGAVVPRAEAATARIQYVSAGSIYLDSGSAAGLVVGMVLRVERDGKAIGELVVDFVAQNSASCRIQSSTTTLRPNDLVVFTPAAPGAAGSAAPSVGVATAAHPSDWSHRGRVGALFLRSSDANGRLDNPMLWAEMAWNGTAQRQVAVRFRGDRPDRFTNDPLAASDPADARVYEASLRYRSAGQRVEVEAGRLLPERLELLGAMDGGGLHFRPTRTLRLGLAAGGGTDYVSTTFATQGAKFGGFVEAGDGRTWRAVVAVGRVDDPDVTRRQFVQVRSDATFSRKLRLFENMEVDLAPSWKKDLGEDGVELTALALGTQALVHRSFDFSLGYEARRALLVPEQRLLPEIEPRELLHSARGSARVGFTRSWSLRLGGDVRVHTDGDLASRSWDALVYGSHLGPLALAMHASGYDADQADGLLLDASLSIPVGTRTRFDFAGGGNRIQTAAGLAGASAPESRWNWIRAGVGIDPGFGLWLRGSGEWRSDDQGRELALELTQQF